MRAGHALVERRRGLFPMTREERIAGALLGTALGDALGLPCEGMSARRIARRFGRVDRFRLLGRTGFVSDDTEQSALVAQSLARHPGDALACARAFRRSLLGWLFRLPWGVGLGTVRACFRILVGFRRTGVRSAGDGAAMRAAVIGASIEDPAKRAELGSALAEVTHVDERAVQGALFTAELAAAGPERGRAVVTNAVLGSALDRAMELAARGAETAEAAEALGTSGYVVHAVPFALFTYLRFGDRPLEALQEAIAPVATRTRSPPSWAHGWERATARPGCPATSSRGSTTDPSARRTSARWPRRLPRGRARRATRGRAQFPGISRSARWS